VIDVPASSVRRSQRKLAEAQLTKAGFPTAGEEIRQMARAAGTDPSLWQCWVDRRLEGEPLEWIVGYTTFLGLKVRVDRGVYVPRPQSELLARRAIAVLPISGVAVDLCTGSGALAVALKAARNGARVAGTDTDPAACRCAAENGVEVYLGHLSDPLPPDLIGNVDVVTAVAPYVPTDEMIFLPRDVRKYEPQGTLDGGKDGVEVLQQVVTAAARILRPGGTLLLELGGTQDELLIPHSQASGLELVARVVDEDDDLRGLHLVLGTPRRPLHEEVDRAGFAG
jgi:release factor glutamine methyltransferase